VPLSTYRAQRRGGKGRSGMSTKDEDFVTRLFVANTHTPILFFSSRGIVYKEKVWRLPLGSAAVARQVLAQHAAVAGRERITTIMPLPEDEDSWGELDVVFATNVGTVRRNKLSDFVQVNRNGKIAMKLEEEGAEILNVATCSEDDDVLLTTSLGQCIRFPVTGIRVFAGRNSVGVRGISLGDGDSVISMSILRHSEATPAERTAYLKQASALRRHGDEGEEEPVVAEDAEGGEEAAFALSDEQYAEMAEAEEFVLTVSEYGSGKRSSSYDFRVSGRGGKGIRATDTSKTSEIGTLVAAFPVEANDQIMLVTNSGKVIRVPVEGIRFASRATKGVKIFTTAEGEHVVSVERIREPEDNGEEGDEDEAPDAPETGGGETPESEA
jgi:DNA gyrase subunit A